MGATEEATQNSAPSEDSSFAKISAKSIHSVKQQSEITLNFKQFKFENRKGGLKSFQLSLEKKG